MTRYAHFCYQDTWILGSVGSNTWRGSLQERRGTNSTEIVFPHMQIDSYMGIEYC